MNRYLVYPTVALLLAACAPGPQQTDLEPVTPPVTPGVMTPAAPETPTEPAVTITSMLASGGMASGGTVSSGMASGGTASGGAGGEAAVNPNPQGEISISTDDATFVTSTSDEVNPVSVPAGGTFYLRLDFSDPDGVTATQIELRNSDAAGTLPTGPFSIASSDCETAVALAPTELRCTVTVAVSPDAQDISEPGETAYAFRPQVTDSLGNSILAFSWAYLNITP